MCFIHFWRQSYTLYIIHSYHFPFASLLLSLHPTYTMALPYFGTYPVHLISFIIFYTPLSPALPCFLSSSLPLFLSLTKRFTIFFLMNPHSLFYCLYLTLSRSCSLAGLYFYIAVAGRSRKWAKRKFPTLPKPSALPSGFFPSFHLLLSSFPDSFCAGPSNPRSCWYP